VQAAALDATAKDARELGAACETALLDVTDEAAVREAVAACVARFGRLDVVVNNAGFVRDRMFVSCAEDEWDAVVRVHLRGHYCVARRACDHWRAESKAGRAVDARIVNTSSGAGLQGSVGQSAYAAAKAGIAALTLVQAAELARYGITANAIAPSARTRMTEGPFADMMRKPEHGFDAMDPANVSPLVVWLGSAESREVTGPVFEVAGGSIAVADGWRTGPRVDKGARFAPDEVGPVVRDLLAKAVPPQKVYGS
jgi:NAD(P)-dependent dehydrogenase (short-subunit alcohol dehydrogenase family)